MNLSEIWIRRPVMTVLVMISILFFGIVGYRQLPINSLPSVDYPTIQVYGSLPGASPETMASTVASPLEKAFSKISGLESMSSQNTEGSTTITLSFSFDRNIDAAAQDVNTAISEAKQTLPAAMTKLPTYTKTNPAQQPILYYVLTAKTMKMSEVQDYAETYLTGELSTINGVSKVEIIGAQKSAVRVRLNPDSMAARGIGLDDVANAIMAGNVNKPGGSLSGNFQAYTMESNGQLKKAHEYNSLIVAQSQGVPVRINDIGQAVDGIANDKVRLWLDTKDEQYDILVMTVNKQPGANAVKIASQVKAKMPELQKLMPQAIEVHLLYDESVFIEESIYDVQFTLLLTIFLVIVVIFLFIRAFTPTLIPALAVPLSLITTFALMQLFGFSLNNLSLMALTLSVGFVVDDAIVMMENIIRRMEQGEDRLQASLLGSKEIGFTILSMTLSLVVVFIPILFLGGLMGKLFREFAVSIAVAIIVSGFISLTLTPMLCSRVLRHNTGKPNKLYQVSEMMFDKALAFYAVTLRWSLGHRKSMLLFTAANIVLSGLLFQYIDKGFIPSQDANWFQIIIQTDERSSIEYLAPHQQLVSDIVIADPNVKGVASVAGVPNSNSGWLIVILHDRSERAMSVDEVMNRLRPQLMSVPGIRAIPINPPPIAADSRQSNGQGVFTLKTTDMNLLQNYAKQMEDAMRSIPGLVDVNSDMQLKKPKISIAVNRERAAAMGLTLSQIQETLYTAYGSRSVSTIYSANSTYDVYVELEPQYLRDPSTLDKLYVKSSSGILVPLSTVAEVTETLAPLAVNHSGQVPAASISFNLAGGGYSMDDAMRDIRAVANNILPSTITSVFEGEAAAMESSFGSLGFLLFVTVFIIYVVLGILYESYMHPITILSALPLAAFGALLALAIFNLPLDVYGFVGVIILVGLVKKNGIMMIDFAVQVEKEENLSPEDSIFQACMTRFRPIMMTTMAAVFGTLPIALGIGAGGDARMSMGVAVVGGLIFSQMLTLYVTPVFYLYMDQLSKLQIRDIVRAGLAQGLRRIHKS